MQAHIFYSGVVQGVGFRFTVQNFALKLGLNGWVKNLPDGRVEVLVEGEEDKLTKFNESVKNQFHTNIRDTEVSFKDKDKEFDSFQITH